ncbi:MAG: hypothetical protein ACLT98_10535 [Eggerthellaceae bacterium]
MSDVLVDRSLEAFFAGEQARPLGYFKGARRRSARIRRVRTCTASGMAFPDALDKRRTILTGQGGAGGRVRSMS